jgi:hypothetical protein
MELYQGLQYISSHPLVVRIIESLVGNLPLLYPCLDGAARSRASIIYQFSSKSAILSHQSSPLYPKHVTQSSRNLSK